MTKPFAAIAVFLCAGISPAVNVAIDYSFDSAGFFSTSTANGRTARATLDFAADFFSDILADTLSPIAVPPTFRSAQFTGTANWEWTASFPDPSSGSTVSLSNQSIPADEYRIYAGARNLSGTTLGVGGPGGFSWRSFNNGGGFTQAEVNQLSAISAAFGDAVDSRGEPTGDFAAWGGAITFDSQGTVWNLDHTRQPSGGQNDLLSVALHELGHALGFGVVDQFTALRSGSVFTGAASRAVNGGVNPGLSPDGGHWLDNAPSLRNPVFGGTTVQEPSLDPTILTGTRKLFTDLDAAGLDDIGWDVVEPAPPVLAGDYNSDGRVDAADYTVYRDSLGTPTVIGSLTEWRANYGRTAASASAIVDSTGQAVPEPGVVALLAPIAATALAGRRWGA